MPETEAKQSNLEHKTFDLVESKAGDEGTFTALASVFGNVDRGGDRMVKGAFTKTLKKWRESGKPIPIILSHQWDNLTAFVGKADPRAVFEDDRGLLVQGKLFMDKESGRDVHRLMKEGLLTGWSFGYKVPKGGQKKAKDGANDVVEVELFEVGPTLVGMNDQALLQEVKSDMVADAKKPVTGPGVVPNHGDCPVDRPHAVVDGEDVVACYATVSEAQAAMANRTASDSPKEKLPEKAPDTERAELSAAYDELGVMREEMLAQAAEMTELRSAYDSLQKTSEERRNKEPERATSPPDPLREKSRRLILETLSDDLTAEDKAPREPEPEPEPQIDDLTFKRQSRQAVLSVLKEGIDGDEE